MTEASGEPVVKADPVFAEAINPRASEYQAGPATRILDFFVATPDCPGEQSAIRSGLRTADDVTRGTYILFRSSFSCHPSVLHASFKAVIRASAFVKLGCSRRIDAMRAS
jgi:hypothetical protein